MRRTLSALEASGVIGEGMTYVAEIDDEITAATADLEGMESEHAWAHASIEPRNLGPSVSDLVYTATEEEWFQETSESLKNVLAVPFLDVTILDRAFPLRGLGPAQLHAWAVVEFSYEDARLDQAIHTVRNSGHSVFTALRNVWRTAVKWTVVRS